MVILGFTWTVSSQTYYVNPDTKYAWECSCDWSQRETSVSIPHRVKWEAWRPDLSEAWFFQLTHWGIILEGFSSGLVPWSIFPLDCASWAEAGCLKTLCRVYHLQGPPQLVQLLCLLTLLHLCFHKSLWTWSLFLSFLPAEICL